MNLTKREREVLLHFALSYNEMAKKLKISPCTVKTHTANIFVKYSPLNTRAGVLIKALKDGDITLDEIVTE